MENKIPLEPSAEVRDKIASLIQELVSTTAPFMIALTPGQRHEMPKMGDKTVPFVEKTANYCELKPDFAPRYLNIEELKINLEMTKGWQSALRMLRPLVENIEDTLLLIGSEAYTTSLTYYNSVKEAARRNVTDAKAVYEDLKQRFPGNTSGKSSEEAEQV